MPMTMFYLHQTPSGTVGHNTVRNLQLGSGLGGCQSGKGIFVQTGAGKSSTVEILATV